MVSTKIVMEKARVGKYTVNTGLFINNEFVAGQDGRTFGTVNPATGSEIATVAEADLADVNIAVDCALKAYREVWRHVAPYERGRLLNRLADLIERDSSHLAYIEAMDNGKPLAVAATCDLVLVVKCFRYYAGWADKIHGKQIDVNQTLRASANYEPFGVVAQIIPWNFPLLMLAWKWGPALAAGNTIVMKTSEKTPLSALYVCALVVEAGFPPGVINVLSGFGPTAGAALASHMDVRKIAFTGSTAVGRTIMVAAANSNLKKVSLELGGKSPNIVFADADIESAVKWTSMGIFFNHGQCCCAGSRIYVHASIYDEFIVKFNETASKIKLGDQMVEGTEHGPLVDSIQFDRVMSFIERGKTEGAHCVVGGNRSGTSGYFIPPTVFTNVLPSMSIATQEIFGPVACIMKFQNVDEVVKLANDSEYGLAAGIHTKNAKLAAQVSADLEAGTVWINCYNVFSEAVPFGGFKQSGIGRELGQEGVMEYLQVKSVIINVA